MRNEPQQMEIAEVGDPYRWEDEWQDMPEFIQHDMQSIHSVAVHFLTVEDMLEFSKLVGNNITFKTKGIFYPPTGSSVKKVYVDEP
jgi:hypothetical protein